MNAEVRARWIGGSFLLLTLTAVLVLAARSPSAAPAAVAQVEGLSCEMKSDAQGPTVQELMEQVIQQRMRNGAGEDADFVVLNNRGYNYGPAPGVDFDSIMNDVAAQAAQAR
jgi:hypothetical protein